MAGKPKNDLLGKVYTDLTVTEYVGKGRWICTCKCGNKREVRAWDLDNGRAKRCLDCSAKSKLSEEVYVGKRFGDWEVLERQEDGWLCICSCGTERAISSYRLTHGLSKSCGHDTGNLKDITGQQFGELTVLRHVGEAKWECQCSCGKITIARGVDLRSGNTASCGCQRGRNEIDLKGKQIGEWSVLEYLGDSYWKCKCSCGAIENVHSYTLRNGTSTRCNAPIHRLNSLVGQRFGMLTVKSWEGNGLYTCECDCGNTKVLKGSNLFHGGTNSCGCETESLMRKTLFEKYGDVTPGKAHSPRSFEQIYKLYDKEEVLKLLIEFYKITGRKPYPKDIADTLGVVPATVLRYVKTYELENYLAAPSSVSSYEYELREMFPGYVASDKKILNGLELDLYYPERKLAIEFNGDYWHSSLFKDKMYHQEKTIQCAKQGIRLIHIFEHEWLTPSTKEKIINILNNILNNNDKIVYARDTEIKSIDVDTSKNFLESYHLQGYAHASISYGLYSKDTQELLGVMTFGKPRFNADYQWELIRLCWKQGVRIIGGAEKLFQHFIRENDPESIVSYCDLSKFSGGVYKKLGFKIADITKPNYVWVKSFTNKVIPRYKTMKHILLKNGLGTPDQTEDEIMDNLGYRKVYDCGNLRFTWNKKK